MEANLIYKYIYIYIYLVYIYVTIPKRQKEKSLLLSALKYHPLYMCVQDKIIIVNNIYIYIYIYIPNDENLSGLEDDLYHIYILTPK